MCYVNYDGGNPVDIPAEFPTLSPRPFDANVLPGFMTVSDLPKPAAENDPSLATQRRLRASAIATEADTHRPS